VMGSGVSLILEGVSLIFNGNRIGQTPVLNFGRVNGQARSFLSCLLVARRLGYGFASCSGCGPSAGDKGCAQFLIT